MPYTRRTYRKRTYRKKAWRKRFKARTRRQMIKPRYGGMVQQPVHYYTQFRGGVVITASSGTQNTYGTMHFKLSDLSNYTTFTSLYEFFKIKAVKVTFIPVSNVTDFGTTAFFDQTAFSNRIITAFDYNDKTAPTSADELRRVKSCRVGFGTRIHKRFIYPKVLVTIDEDGPGINSYGVGVMNNPWISTGYNQTEYFGIKYALVHPNLTTNTDMYSVEFKYYLAFKGRK